MEKIVKDLFQSHFFDNLIGEVQVDMVTWLGKYTGERNRPILVTSAMLPDQNLILKNKANLPKGVYVEEDFPFEVQEWRNILRPIVSLALNHRNYRGKVTLQHDKIILDNKRVWCEWLKSVVKWNFTEAGLSEIKWYFSRIFWWA